MASVSDFLVTVPSSETAVIQEIHIAAGHMFCFLVDHFLFEAVSRADPLSARPVGELGGTTKIKAPASTRGGPFPVRRFRV